MRNVNFDKKKEIWVEFPEDKEIKFKIRAFPISQGMYIPGNTDETIFEYYNKKVLYCVLDWEGIQADGKPLICNDENKNFIFNYEEDLFMFIITELSKNFENRELSTEKKT